MKYENPEVDERVNLPSEHPLKDFAILAAGIGIISLVSFLALFAMADSAARSIPFSFEQALFDRMNTDSFGDALIRPSDRPDIETYLQSLANRLATAQQLPTDMPVTVHYIKSDVINAYAMLGGHLVINSALLAECDDENTLAMALAHEIAHIQHRHPIIAIGRGFTIAAAMLSILGISETELSNQFIGYFAITTQMAYGRSHEMQADNTALETLQTYYGHVRGANRLFSILDTQHPGQITNLLSTHPLAQTRTDNVQRFIKDNPSPKMTSIALPSWPLD